MANDQIFQKKNNAKWLFANIKFWWNYQNILHAWEKNHIGLALPLYISSHSQFLSVYLSISLARSRSLAVHTWFLNATKIRKEGEKKVEAQAQEEEKKKFEVHHRWRRGKKEEKSGKKKGEDSLEKK